jgi:cobalt/nickel transport protein
MLIANKKIAAIAIIAIVLAMVVAPLIFMRDAEFRGSDDAGSEMVDEVTGGKYMPWFDPIIETYIGGQMPREMETLLFSVQTGVGAAVLAYCFGYLVARKKYGGRAEAYGDEMDESNDDAGDKANGYARDKANGNARDSANSNARDMVNGNARDMVNCNAKDEEGET